MLRRRRDARRVYYNAAGIPIRRSTCERSIDAKDRNIAHVSLQCQIEGDVGVTGGVGLCHGLAGKRGKPVSDGKIHPRRGQALADVGNAVVVIVGVDRIHDAVTVRVADNRHVSSRRAACAIRDDVLEDFLARHVRVHGDRKRVVGIELDRCAGGQRHGLAC